MTPMPSSTSWPSTRLAPPSSAVRIGCCMSVSPGPAAVSPPSWTGRPSSAAAVDGEAGNLETGPDGQLRAVGCCERGFCRHFDSGALHPILPFWTWRGLRCEFGTDIAQVRFPSRVCAPSWLVRALTGFSVVPASCGVRIMAGA